MGEVLERKTMPRSGLRRRRQRKRSAIVALLKLLGSEVRWRVVCALADGPCGTTDLAARVRATACQTSISLGELYDAGLVDFTVDGANRIYAFTDVVRARRSGSGLELTVTTGEGRVAVFVPLPRD
jgi:DNA-binding transcriptional ArsR family regulator